VFNILNETTTLENSCVCSKVPAEASYRSNPYLCIIPCVYATLCTEKVNLFNKQRFCRNNKFFCGINSYNACSNAVFRHWHNSTIVLPLVYCPVDDTLFEFGPEISGSGVSSRYCCYGNHTAGSKPILKLLLQSRENWIRYVCAENNLWTLWTGEVMSY